MSKKTISAKPREASKAPLSPRGKAPKMKTATKPGDVNTLAEMLEAMLDKKLGEIEKRISERLAKAVDDITFEIAFANYAPDGTSLVPLEAIPATYKEATPWPCLTFNDEAWTSGALEPDKEYIERKMKDAEACAHEIGNRDPEKIGDVLCFLDAKENGHFRTNIVERLLYFPRIVIDGEDVRIGALQLFEKPTNDDEEAAIDQKARAPFDQILNTSRAYLEKAGAKFPEEKEKLNTVRDKLQELAEALKACSGVPGERRESSEAAKAAISAAREARRAIEVSDPRVMFANEMKRRTNLGLKKDAIINDLLNEGYAQAFKQGTTFAAARQTLYRAGLIQDSAKKKR